MIERLICLFKGHNDQNYGMQDGEFEEMSQKQLNECLSDRRVKCGRCNRVKIIKKPSWAY